VTKTPKKKQRTAPPLPRIEGRDGHSFSYEEVVRSIAALVDDIDQRLSKVEARHALEDKLARPPYARTRR
jgi:hypothetical protein